MYAAVVHALSRARRRDCISRMMSRTQHERTHFVTGGRHYLLACLLVPILSGCGSTAMKHHALADVNQPVCAGHYRSPRPLAVLLEQSFLEYHWESEIPKFVLFADGRVIFARCHSERECSYFEAQLSGEEFRRFREALTPSAEFLKLESTYTLISNVTDMPTVDILLADEMGLRRVSVYGLFHEGATAAAYAVLGPPGKPDSLPEEFARYVKTLHELTPAASHPWSPAYLSVQLERADRYANSAEDLAKPPLNWPRWLPKPSSGSHVKSKDEVFEIFIRAHQEGRLERLAQRACGEDYFGISLGDERWVFSRGHPVVPGACEWDHAESN